MLHHLLVTVCININNYKIWIEKIPKAIQLKNESWEET